MLSNSLSVLLASVSLVSLAAAQKVQIVSPKPGCAVVPGTTLNLKLKIDGNLSSSTQVALGFGLNCETKNVTSLGKILLGTLDTTKTPFDSSTMMLNYPLQIPAAGKFPEGVDATYSLVVSQYYLSGVRNTPDCNVVSVPVQVGAGPSGPSSDNSTQVPTTPAGQPSETPVVDAEQPPSNGTTGPDADTPDTQSPTDDALTPGGPSDTNTTSDSPLGSGNATTPAPDSDIPSSGDSLPSTNDTAPITNGSMPITNGTAPITNGTIPSPSNQCSGSSSNASDASYPDVSSDSNSTDSNSTSGVNGTSDWSANMTAGCPTDVGATGANSTDNSTDNIFTPPQSPEAGGSNSTDTSAAGSLGLSAQSVAISFAVVLGCMTTLA